MQVDELDEDADAAGNGGGAVLPTPLGRVASFYYLRHSTAGLMAEQFRGQQLDHAQVGGWCWLQGGQHTACCAQDACGMRPAGQ